MKKRAKKTLTSKLLVAVKKVLNEYSDQLKNKAVKAIKKSVRKVDKKPNKKVVVSK